MASAVRGTIRPALRLVHHFTRAADIADHQRGAAGERFDPGIGQAFACRRQHHRARGAEHDRQLVMVDRAEEMHPLRHAETCSQTPQLRLVRTRRRPAPARSAAAAPAPRSPAPGPCAGSARRRRRSADASGANRRPNSSASASRACSRPQRVEARAVKPGVMDRDLPRAGGPAPPCHRPAPATRRAARRPAGAALRICARDGACCPRSGYPRRAP